MTYKSIAMAVVVGIFVNSIQLKAADAQRQQNEEGFFVHIECSCRDWRPHMRGHSVAGIQVPRDTLVGDLKDKIVPGLWVLQGVARDRMMFVDRAENPVAGNRAVAEGDWFTVRPVAEQQE